MSRPRTPDCNVTVVVRACDDEERIGHVLRRLCEYLSSLHLTFELLLVDEGSGDNTVAVAALLRRSFSHIEVIHARPQDGYVRACKRARGRAVVLCDARTEAPLGALGFAFGRLQAGFDVVALSGRYLVFRRTRAWRAFDSLVERRDLALVEKRFLKKAQSLGLRCTTAQSRSGSTWSKLRDALLLGRPLRSFT